MRKGKHWGSEKVNPHPPVLPKAHLAARGRESLELDLSMESENSLDFVTKVTESHGARHHQEDHHLVG